MGSVRTYTRDALLLLSRECGRWELALRLMAADYGAEPRDSLASLYRPAPLASLAWEEYWTMNRVYRLSADYCGHRARAIENQKLGNGVEANQCLQNAEGAYGMLPVWARW
jgi:hypothetical protein